MSVLDTLFGSRNPEPQDQQQQQQTPDPAPTEPSFEEKYKDLWEPPSPENQPKNFDPTKLYDGTDPNKLQEEINKLNFLGGISPDDVKAVAAGGEEAIRALTNMLNQTARQVYQAATHTSMQLVQHGVAKTTPAVEQMISQRLRDREVSLAVSNSDPIFKDPMVAPLLEGLKTQLAVKHPTAGPDEIATMAKEFISETFNRFSRNKESSKPSTGPKEVDWDEWIKNSGNLG